MALLASTAYESSTTTSTNFYKRSKGGKPVSESLEAETTKHLTLKKAKMTKKMQTQRTVAFQFKGQPMVTNTLEKLKICLKSNKCCARKHQLHLKQALKSSKRESTITTSARLTARTLTLMITSH